MSRAGCWLEECSIDIGEVVNLENLASWVGTELGETTICGILAGAGWIADN
jgi:hypothetical protein